MIELNKKILEGNPENIASLNRLARAQWEIGKLQLAKKTYQKVIRLDAHNCIANKNLSRLADQQKPCPPPSPGGNTTNARIFLEEPGKTKVVKLVRLASPETLSGYDSGDEVYLVPKKLVISVCSGENIYLGSIPDDLSRYLMGLIKAGNCYQAFIRFIDRQSLEVLIRETKRSPKKQHHPSFGYYKRTG